MSGKRKFLIEHANEWTDYEQEFVKLCNERKWFIDNEDETGTPILYPSRKKMRPIYRVSAHGRDKSGSILISLCITADHGRTKEALLKKAEKANLGGYIRVDGDTDADYIFPIDRLPRAVKTFNLRRKQNHKGPPKEAIARGQQALREWRNNQSVQ